MNTPTVSGKWMKGSARPASGSTCCSHLHTTLTHTWFYGWQTCDVKTSSAQCVRNIQHWSDKNPLCLRLVLEVPGSCEETAGFIVSLLVLSFCMRCEVISPPTRSPSDQCACWYSCTFAMRSTSMAQSAANRDTTKSPLSISHHSALPNLPVQRGAMWFQEWLHQTVSLWSALPLCLAHTHTHTLSRDPPECTLPAFLHLVSCWRSLRTNNEVFPESRVLLAADSLHKWSKEKQRWVVSGLKKRDFLFARLSSCINGLLSMTESLQIDLYIRALWFRIWY